MKKHGRLNKKIRKNRYISYFLTMLLISQLILSTSSIDIKIYADDSGYVMEWNKSDIIDEQLDISENSAGDEDILMEIEFVDNGEYVLEYILEDNQKTQVTFDKSEDEVEVDFNIFYIDADEEYTMTEDLADEYYAERDYDTYTMVEDEDVTFSADGAIEFTIEDSSSNDYIGVEFNIDQRTVIIKWDSSDDVLYYYFDSYEPGNIMGVSLEDPEDTLKELNILKSLENFEAIPTQYQLVDNLIVEADPIVYPFDEDEDEGEEILPGEKPGVEITFTQPKILGDDYLYSNENTDLADYGAIIVFEEFDDGERLDLEFSFADETDTPDGTISSVNWSDSNDENEDGNEVSYNYDLDDKEYTINILQDKEDFTDALEADEDDGDEDTDLDEDTEDIIRSMVEWSHLSESTVYDIELTIETDSDEPEIELEADDFTPEEVIAYTYLDYELVRSGVDEAYLSINPYNVGEDEEVTYYILQSDSTSNLDIDDDLWLTHYYDEDSDTSEIYIAVPFDEDTENNYYQVIVDYAEHEFASQVLQYDALNDDYVSTVSTSIDEIDNLYVVPTDDDESDPNAQIIQFDLVWTAPTEDEMDTIFEADPNAIIYYEVMVNTYAYETDESEYEVVKIFEVYNSADDDDDPVPALRDYSGALGSDIYGDPNPADDDDEDQIYHYNDYETGYNSEDQLFRMNDVVIYTDELDDGWINVVESDLSDDGSVEYTDTPYEFNYENDDDDNGVNYLRIRATVETSGTYGQGDRSVPYGLTLSDVDMDIPAPDNLDYEMIDDEEVELQFDTVDTSEYEQYMLYAIDREVTEVRYRVFLATGENTFDEDIPEDLDDDDDYIEISKDEDDLDVSIDEDDLEELYDVDYDGISKVLYFDYVVDDDEDSINSTIEGLDGNDTYYVTVQTILTDDNVSGDSDENTDTSDLSEVISFTAAESPDEPDESEISPVSIEDLTVAFEEDSEIEIQIDFDYGDEIGYEEGTHGFEIISIEGMELPDDLDTTSYSLEDVIDDDELEDEDVEGWRTYVDDDDYEFIKYEDSDWDDADDDALDPTDGHIEIVDTVNNYNKVYYYYVRTVKYDTDDPDEIISYSSWVGATITTSPISKPINLDVEYDYYDDDEYDAEHEVVISFDADIPYETDIGSNEEYDFQISIKGDEDDEYKQYKYDSDLIKQTDDGENGYTKYYYLIEDLESNSSYYIKVRIIDNENDGDTSSYSDSVEARTEFSQDDYDSEVAYEEYLEVYEDRVEDLFKQPYLLADTNNNKSVMKYREDYGVGDLLVSANDSYELYVSDDDINSYYFPSNYIEEMNEYDVDLTIDIDGNKVTIRNDSLGVDYTDLIRDKSDDISSLSSDYEDYYVLLTIESYERTSKVNGLEPLSEEIDIEIYIVESELTEEDMEYLIEDAYDDIVEDVTDELIDDLEDSLEDGIDEDELLEIVDDAYEDTVEQLAEEIEELLDDNTDYDEDDDEVEELESYLQIKLNNNTDSIAEAYYYHSSAWQEIDSVVYGQNYYINSTDVTNYIIAKWSTVEDSYQDEYTSEELALISNYDLEDTIGIGLLNDPDSSYFYQKLIEAGAAIAGYSGEYEASMEYLQWLDIEIPDQDEFTYADRGNSMIVLTGIYCEVNNIDINNYHILDFNKIEDLDMIDEEYQKIILVGEDLGIFDLDSYDYLNPTSDITIEELIEILNIIDKANEY